MKPLVPCSQCARHVRASEPACPFCGASIAANAGTNAVPSTAQRLGRNATFVFATTLTLAACATPAQPGDVPNATDSPTVADRVTPVGDTGVVDDNGGVGPLYGGPFPVDVPNASDASGDTGTIGAMYGVPPPFDSGVIPDSGSPGARYGGAPPPRDN